VSPAIYVVVVTMGALLAAIVGLPSRWYLGSSGIFPGPADPRAAEV
jgi:hypothetical protein